MKRIFSLDGTWNFRRLSESTVEELSKTPRNAQERKIAVPSNWHLQGEDFAGSALYRRAFPAPHLEKGSAAFLRIKGSDYYTRVRLNGQVLGRHEGYFQTFELEATEALGTENLLEIEVASPKENRSVWPHGKWMVKGIFNHHDARPGSWNVEHGQDGNTGGLWGGVELVVVRHAWIRSVRVTPVRLKDGRALAQLRVGLFNPGEAREVELSAAFQGATFKGPKTATEGLRHFMPHGASECLLVHTFEKPRWWWTWDQGPSDLYEARVSLREGHAGRETESETVRFGLREVKVTEGWEFFLNGRKFFPRGTNIIPTQYLAEYGEKEARRDVAMMRAANLNAVRVHAHVNRREFYDACDEAGLMVWQDFALQWSYERSDAFMQNACRQAKDMVRALYNHPSILVWCCHNEPSVNREEMDPLLQKAVREEDASRFVDTASDFRYHPYPGWYWYDSVLKDSFGAIGEKTALVSEFGAQALPRVSTLKRMFTPKDLWPPKWDAWELRDFQYHQTFNVAQVPLGKSLAQFVENSQAYQARLVKDYTESCRMRKYAPVQALFHFMFVDCWPAITWSVVDFFRNPKAGYRALAAANQPLLPVWRNVVPQVNPGMKLNWGGPFLKELTLVNDYPREFRNLKVSLTVENPRGRVIWRESRVCPLVPSDSVTQPFQTQEHHGEGHQAPLAPTKGPLGDYTVRIKLFDGKRQVAENTETIKVAPKKPKTT